VTDCAAALLVKTDGTTNLQDRDEMFPSTWSPYSSTRPAAADVGLKVYWRLQAIKGSGSRSSFQITPRATEAEMQHY